MQSVNKRVIVGMSGGVDSSVAALLLQQQGYQVEGLFMKNWEEDDGSEYCTAEQDVQDAQAVCDTLGIRLHRANFAAEYWDDVFEHFLQEYQAGRTPNPDILCNREIKFKAFLQYAQMLGAEGIATGHYAKVGHQSGHTLLQKGIDTNKDQSYFLHQVPASALEKTLFPLGDLTKPQIRTLAEEHHLVTHNKKDSTGICFIGERRFRDFLQQYLPAQPGRIETSEGEVVGEHNGLMYYTLGQRQGLSIGGKKGQPELPWYVADKDLTRNVLIVVQGVNHPKLFSQALYCTELFSINDAYPIVPGRRYQAKVRYRQPDQWCTLKQEKAGGPFAITFDNPQRAVTPGQSVVLYENEHCLGGGVIERTRL